MPTLQEMAKTAAVNNGVPPDIFTALVNKESNWNQYAVGSAGEMGLSQITPANIAALGVGDPFDPQSNLNAGAGLLAAEYNRFGNWFDALRAYNAGYPAAKSNPDISAGYANDILGAALPSQKAAAQNTGTARQDTTQDSPAFLSDPWGYFKSKLSSVAFVAVFILIIAALVWFGFQQVIKE